MGLTNFVGRHILSSRTRHPADPPPPGTPRRRRLPSKDRAAAAAAAAAATPSAATATTPATAAASADRLPPPSSARPADRPRRFAHPAARSTDRLDLAAPFGRPHPVDRLSRPSYDKLHSHPQTPPSPLSSSSSPPPPSSSSSSSRRLAGWRRPRTSARVRSNLETRFREPPTPTPANLRDLQAAAAAHEAASPGAGGGGAKPWPKGGAKDPATDLSSPSLKRLLGGRGGAVQYASGKTRPSVGGGGGGGGGGGAREAVAHEAASRRKRSHFHRPNHRIRSNLDQLMRREKSKDMERRQESDLHRLRDLEWDKEAQRDRERRMLAPMSARRRHSLLAEAPLHAHHNFDDEPISLINEFLHSHHGPLFDDLDPLPPPNAPRFAVTAAPSPPPSFSPPSPSPPPPSLSPPREPVATAPDPQSQPPPPPRPTTPARSRTPLSTPPPARTPVLAPARARTPASSHAPALVPPPLPPLSSPPQSPPPPSPPPPSSPPPAPATTPEPEPVSLVIPRRSLPVPAPTPRPLPYARDPRPQRYPSPAASTASFVSSSRSTGSGSITTVTTTSTTTTASSTSTATTTMSPRASRHLAPTRRRPPAVAARPPVAATVQPMRPDAVLPLEDTGDTLLSPANGSDTDVEDEPPSLRRRFADTEIVGPAQARFSADAAYPARVRQPVSPAFVRSPSNPTPATQAPALPVVAPKRTQWRPPPLRTPTNDATGFACGVGDTSLGIRRVAMVSSRQSSSDSIRPLVEGKKHEAGKAVGRERREIRDSRIKKESERFTEEILPLQVTAEDREVRSAMSPPGLGSTSKSRYSAAGVDSDEASNEPKSHSRFDVWSADHSREGSSGSFSGSRFSRKPSERDMDLFYFEEASQSSFGDTETPSRRAARNGIMPLERRKELAEVTEDHFIFAADGSFKDGDITISSDGLVEPPERVMRKRSDGLAVEGVPTSSNNLIFVKSLDEFRKSFTFKAKSREGSPTLGRGAAGRVYLANHEPTGRKIAVKEINVYDEEKRNQLKKELQTLTSHQSRFLVRTFGAFYDGAGVVHVTLEYMDRGSLSDIVMQRGRIPEPVVCKIAEHCLRGLSFLHDNHILHRDVKTGNILLSRKLCRAKLSDFGLARDLIEGSSVVDTFVGTLVYMSPERLHGSEYTYASDIWGLGISILECMLGRHPFEKPQSFFDIVDAATDSSVASLAEGQATDAFSDFIRLCTQVDPKERPKARELLQHAWFQSRRDDTNALREWLDTIPRLHCEDVKIGSELAFSAKAAKDAKAMEKMRAFKAQESSL